MRNRYVLVGDLCLIAFAVVASFVLRLTWVFGGFVDQFTFYLVAALVAKPIVFQAFGLYSRYWRYASIQDLIAVLLANGAAGVVMFVIVTIALAAGVMSGFSRSILAIDWLITLCCVAGLRLSVRIAGESLVSMGGRQIAGERRALIVGAGLSGTLVARELQRNPQLGITAVGFLDDDVIKLRKRILGLPVLGRLASLEQIAATARATEVIIALPRASGRVVRAVAESCRAAGLPSRTVPGMYELLDGKVSVNRLRPVEIADLLRRAQVGGSATAEYLAGRVVIVTGAGGSIGSELCRQIARARPARLVLLGHGENTVFDIDAELKAAFPDVPVKPVIADIRDRARLEHLFDLYRPDVVFHAAAHKHVPLMQENPEEAVTNNVIGTSNVVTAARRVRAQRLVLISTDKAVAPTSVMGASKRMAEMIVLDAWRRYGQPCIVVRFGNVLGSSGSVVPSFKRQIEARGPVTITHPEMKRFFMTIPEAVHLVLQAGMVGSGGELLVLDMGEPIRVVDLAQDLIKLSGYEVDEIPIVYTGVRPGEKLEERLWEDGATVTRTANSQILRVSEPEGLTSDALDVTLADLNAAAQASDPRAISTIFGRCLPSYAPSPIGPADAALRVVTQEI